MKIKLGFSSSIPAYVLENYVVPEFQKKKYEVSFHSVSDASQNMLSKTIKEQELDGVLLWPHQSEWKLDKNLVLASILRKLDSHVMVRSSENEQWITNSAFVARQWRNEKGIDIPISDLTDKDFAEYLAENDDQNGLYLGTFSKIFYDHGVSGKKLKGFHIPFGCNQLIIVSTRENTAVPVVKKLEPKNTRYLYDTEQTFYNSLSNPKPERVSCEASYKDGKIIFQASALNKSGSQRVDVSVEDSPDDFGTDDVKILVAQFIQKGANALLAEE